MSRASSQVKVKGFFRLQITEDKDGKTMVIGDSGISKNGKLINGDGFRKNLVANLGFQDFLCQTLGGMAGSKTISHVALGTGGAPIATDTTLAGEIMSSTQRKTVSPSTISSKTLQMTAAFASANSFLTASANLSNIGLFNSSTAGGFFAGNTYASSSCNTNQNVNVTYQVRFS